MGDFEFLDKIPTQKPPEDQTLVKAARYVRRRVTCEKEREVLLEMLGLAEGVDE